MSLDEFIAKMKSDIEILTRAAPSMSNEIAESSLTMIKDRSINEGINIDGNANEKAEYSTRPTRTDKFRKNILNKAGDSYIQANLMGTWHGFRKAQGLSSAKVNLSYTNDMWSKIQVLSTNETSPGKAETTVGTYDAETWKKMQSNEFRFGEFLVPLPEEVQLAEEVLQEKILKLLRQ
jgi:hypothetical protein